MTEKPMECITDSQHESQLWISPKTGSQLLQHSTHSFQINHRSQFTKYESKWVFNAVTQSSNTSILHASLHTKIHQFFTEETFSTQYGFSTQSPRKKSRVFALSPSRLSLCSESFTQPVSSFTQVSPRFNQYAVFNLYYSSTQSQDRLQQLLIMLSASI